MSVCCKIIHDGKLSPSFSYVCFGFMSGLVDRAKITNGVNASTWGSLFPEDYSAKSTAKISEIQYFPKKYSDMRTWSSAHDKFVLALEKLNINKVIQYLKPDAKTPKQRYSSGLRADCNKFSAPMFTGAFEVYRLLQKDTEYLKMTEYLLDNGIAPKLAVFMPVFFRGGTCGNTAINKYSITPGYGSFDVWTPKHLREDKYEVAIKAMSYNGIHKCYKLRVKKPLKTPLSTIVGHKGFIQFDSTNMNDIQYSRERTRRLILQKTFTNKDLLDVCRKMQNGRL